MIPLNDSNTVGQPTLTLLRDIIATVLDVTIISWSHLLASMEVNAKSSEPDIAGRLGRAMIAEKNRRNLKISASKKKSEHDHRLMRPELKAV